VDQGKPLSDRQKNAYDFQRALLSLRNYPTEHLKDYLVGKVTPKSLVTIFKFSSIETDDLGLCIKALKENIDNVKSTEGFSLMDFFY